jgi:putative transposase
MGRPKRIAFGGYVYQVLNRANGRLRIFKKGGDFEAFEQVLSEGIERFDMRICGWCLMGNQWHLMLWPRRDGDLSAFMRWTTLTHVQRFHASHGTVGIGHLYQGRYKSFPDQDNACYLTVMRYVEGNPVRAGIVKHAADWRWSSFSVRQGRDSKVGLAEGPLSLPGDWESLVHCEIDPKSAEEIGKSVKRGRPLGDADWRTGTAKELNLEATLREKGRPKKVPDTFT